jgi:hypothetical protein
MIVGVRHPDMVAYITGLADGHQLMVISAFWDTARQRQQIGLA